MIRFYFGSDDKGFGFNLRMLKNILLDRFFIYY